MPGLNAQNVQALKQLDIHFQDEVEPHIELGQTTRRDVIGLMGTPYHIYQYSDGRTEFQYVYPLYSDESLTALQNSSKPFYALFHKKELETVSQIRNRWISLVFQPDKTLESYTVTDRESDLSSEGMVRKEAEKYEQSLHVYDGSLDRDTLVRRLKIGKTTSRQVMNLPDFGEPDEVADDVWIYRFAPKSTELAIKAAQLSAAMREPPSTGTSIAQGMAQNILGALIPGASMVSSGGQYIKGAVDTVSNVAKNVLYTAPLPLHLEFDADGILNAFYFIDPGSLTPEEQALVQEMEATAAVQREARP